MTALTSHMEMCTNSPMQFQQEWHTMWRGGQGQGPEGSSPCVCVCVDVHRFEEGQWSRLLRTAFMTHRQVATCATHVDWLRQGQCLSRRTAMKSAIATDPALHGHPQIVSGIGSVLGIRQKQFQAPGIHAGKEWSMKCGSQRCRQTKAVGDTWERPRRAGWGTPGERGWGGWEGQEDKGVRWGEANLRTNLWLGRLEQTDCLFRWSTLTRVIKRSQHWWDH